MSEVGPTANASNENGQKEFCSDFAEKQKEMECTTGYGAQYTVQQKGRRKKTKKKHVSSVRSWVQLSAYTDLRQTQDVWF